jgi:hypothetical protein
MLSKNKKLSTIAGNLLIAAPLFFISGCTLSNTLKTGDGDGTVKIVLEGPSPAYYDPRMLEAYITITEIDVSSDGGEWMMVSSIGSPIDLLQLNRGVTAVLSVTGINPAVSYEVRLLLGTNPGDNYVLVDKGGPPEQHDIDTPSGPQTGLKISQPFEVTVGSTTTVLLTFEEGDYTFDPDSDIYRLNPTITVNDVDIREGNIVFYDNFGYGAGTDTVTGWIEDESLSAVFKCSVLDGSVVGGRHARIYGEDVFGVNHSFFHEWDMSEYSSGRIVFQARRSDNWSTLLSDYVFVELFYDGSWHPAYTFSATNIFDSYSVLEIRLIEEMMDTQFYVRFRNGLPDALQYLDIDNFELYGIK